MATSKTGTFILTETIEVLAGNSVGNGTIDLGSYVDVGDQQALAIESVDVIWQRQTAASGDIDSLVSVAAGGNAAFDLQLTDLNRAGVIVRADDRALIASGSINIDNANNVVSLGPDVYPDQFGKLDEARMVVNDQIYVSAHSTLNIAVGFNLLATVRIHARIVKLSQKDWMSIAIQSTAADN
jgi:hypothetical protein